MLDLAATLRSRADYHTHSTFSDGENTPEEMVQAAIMRGLVHYGLSDHSPLPFDPEPYMGGRADNSEEAYRAEMARLKDQYKYFIHLHCGIEQDIFSAPPSEDYDYVIGSVHYVEVPNEASCTKKDPKTGKFYVSIDEELWMVKAAIKECFGGDPYALVEAYYELVGQVVERTGCDIIGHFDLIKKFNGGGTDLEPVGRFFDENHPRYIAAWQAAADKLLETGVPFEINTGAVRGGFTEEPYPGAAIQKYLREHNAKFLRSSDAHMADDIAWSIMSRMSISPDDKREGEEQL